MNERGDDLAMDPPPTMSLVMSSIAETIAEHTSTYLASSRIGVVVIVSPTQTPVLQIAKFDAHRFNAGEKHVYILHSVVGRSKQTVSEYLLRRIKDVKGVEVQLMTNIIESWDAVNDAIARMVNVGDGGVGAPVGTGQMSPLELLRASYDRISQSERMEFVQKCIVGEELYEDTTKGLFTIATTAIQCLLPRHDLLTLRTAPQWDLFVKLAQRFE
jgi:hypothetical protein